MDTFTNQERFVYNQVYNGCKAKGLPDGAAYDAATNAVIDYKRHKFKSGIDLIQSSIKKSVATNKKDKKNGIVQKN